MKISLNLTRRNVFYLVIVALILIGVGLSAYSVWQNRDLNKKLNQTNEKVTNIENNYLTAGMDGGPPAPGSVDYEIVSKSKKSVKLLDQTQFYATKEEPAYTAKEVQVVKVKATNNSEGTATLDFYSLSAKTDKGLVIQQAITADASLSQASSVYGLEPKISTEFTLYFDTQDEIVDLYNQASGI